MGRRPEQRSKALRYLRGEAEKARLACREALPGVKQLARAAGVGYNTMWAALQECKVRGELRVKPHAGIRVVADAPGVPDDERPAGSGLRSKGARAGARLELDILRGTYLPGTVLPSVKVLCGRYGVCAVTLRRALDRLCTQGFLSRERRGYRCGVSPVRAGARIVLVARGDGHGNVRSYAPRSMMHFRLIEQECARRGVGLHTLTHYYVEEECRGSEEVRRTVERDRTENSVLGYLMMTASVPDEPLAADLQYLVHCGKPVAVFDETVAAPALHRRFRGPLLRYYVLPDDRAAGGIVGAYLVRLGHRRVLFLSHVGAYRGSAAQRHGGVVGALAGAGAGEDGVRLVELPMAEVDWTHNPHDYEAGLRALLELHRESLRGGSAADHTGFVERQAEEVGERAGRYARRRRYWHALGSVLEQEAATAWVCYNDELALDCLDLVLQRGIDVPGALSVVGFDDSDEASRAGLTSYNFNGEAYVHAMVEHILNPGRGSVYRRTGDIVRFDGYVTPRGTVGRVLGDW